MGLANLQDRVETIGGELTIESLQGAGTTVRLDSLSEPVPRSQGPNCPRAGGSSVPVGTGADDAGGMFVRYFVELPCPRIGDRRAAPSRVVAARSGGRSATTSAMILTEVGFGDKLRVARSGGLRRRAIAVRRQDVSPCAGRRQDREACSRRWRPISRSRPGPAGPARDQRSLRAAAGRRGPGPRSARCCSAWRRRRSRTSWIMWDRASRRRALRRHRG